MSNDVVASTQLRAIDSNLDILVTQANNAGTRGTIGARGVDATSVDGFDIGTSGKGYAIFADVLLGSSRAYTIDLSAGAGRADRAGTPSARRSYANCLSDRRGYCVGLRLIDP